MSSSSSDSADSEDDDTHTLRCMQLQRQIQFNISLTACLLGTYYSTYHDKNEPRTSPLSGYDWVIKTLNTPGESHRMFRLNESIFYSLHDLLVSNYGLKSSNNISSMESLAIFLVTCGHCWSNMALQNIFNHSGEIISRKFFEVLNCVVGMSEHYIRPIDPNFTTVHGRIRADHRMWPHFKDCIGAIDGSHINATPIPKDLIRYIGRSGKPTQNVMAVVDFDMRFTYASIGQPGSMHDTTVLYHAIEADTTIFPHPPLGT